MINGLEAEPEPWYKIKPSEVSVVNSTVIEMPSGTSLTASQGTEDDGNLADLFPSNPASRTGAGVGAKVGRPVVDFVVTIGGRPVAVTVVVGAGDVANVGLPVEGLASHLSTLSTPSLSLFKFVSENLIWLPNWVLSLRLKAFMKWMQPPKPSVKCLK